LKKTKFEEINNDDIAQPIMVKEKSISYYIRTYLKRYDQNLVKSLILRVASLENCTGL